MAGWLDDFFNAQATGQPLPGGLLAMLGQMGQSAGFPPNATSAQEQAAADEARAAAAGRLAKGVRRPSIFDVGASAAPSLYGDFAPAGLPQAAAAPSSGAAPDLPPPIDVATPPASAGLQGPPSFPPDAQASMAPPAMGRAAAASPVAAAPYFPPILGDIGRNILQGLRDNSNSLIAGGGAMISGGLGHGLSALAAASPLDIALRKERQGNEAIAATQKALEARGIDPAQARALALDPAYRKEVLLPRQHVTITDAMGNQRPVTFDPFSGQYFGMDGRPLAQAAGAGIASALPEGPDWFDKLPKEMQIEAKNYALGLAIPTGNPRKGASEFIKQAANRWAQENGLVVDESRYGERAKLVRDLASSTPNSMGGILSNGKSAFGHLALVGDNFVKLGNYSGPNLPGGALLGKGANLVTNTLATGPGGELVSNANKALDRYGAESTKFYAGTGGGVQERAAARNEVNAQSSTAQAQAGFLETEKQLMLERLAEKEHQIETEMGPGFLKQHPVMDDRMRATIEKIDKSIATLRGQRPAAEAARPITKAEYDALPKGAPYTAPDGSQRIKQ